MNTQCGLSAEDERAVTAVLVRYATGVDRRDWTLFATCFTADLIAEYDGLGSWQGRDALVDYMAKGTAGGGPTLHKVSNFSVSVSGNLAMATSYVDALLMPLEPGGKVRRAQGRYEDQLVRGEDGWKISKRHFIPVQITETAS